MRRYSPVEMTLGKVVADSVQLGLLREVFERDMVILMPMHMESPHRDRKSRSYRPDRKDDVCMLGPRWHVMKLSSAR